MQSSIPNPQSAIPPIVQHFADQMHMVPMAWNVHDSFVVIVFEPGPKYTFPITGKELIKPKVTAGRPNSTEQKQSKLVGVQHAAPAPIAPAIQALPVKKTVKKTGRVI